MGHIISVKHKGSFNNFEKFCNAALGRKYMNVLNEYAELGCEMLRRYTPSESGKTAESWSWDIEDKGGVTTITYSNSNMSGGENVAILIYYGHGTRNGGYVEGTDYINPALTPVFKDLAGKITAEILPR